jgi:hypothetical protein
MRAAIYYPHTQIRNETFLKNALLLWDEVGFVSPNQHFQFTSDLAPEIRDSLELLCRPTVPSDVQKQEVHLRVKKLLSSGVPKWLLARPTSLLKSRPIREFFGHQYGVYQRRL